MIKIFKLIKNVNKQNIYRFTAKKKKKQRHKQLQIPTQGRDPVREKAASGDPQRRHKTS